MIKRIGARQERPHDPLLRAAQLRQALEQERRDRGRRGRSAAAPRGPWRGRARGRQPRRTASSRARRPCRSGRSPACRPGSPLTASSTSVTPSFDHPIPAGQVRRRDRRRRSRARQAVAAVPSACPSPISSTRYPPGREHVERGLRDGLGHAVADERDVRLVVAHVRHQPLQIRGLDVGRVRDDEVVWPAGEAAGGVVLAAARSQDPCARRSRGRARARRPRRRSRSRARPAARRRSRARSRRCPCRRRAPRERRGRAGGRAPARRRSPSRGAGSARAGRR